MKKKSIISTIIIISIIIVVGIIMYILTNDSKNEENTTNMVNTANSTNAAIINENTSVLLRDKITLRVAVTNITIKEEGDLTHFSAKVQSIEGDINQKNIVVVFKNSDATDFARVEAQLPNIKYGEIATMEFTTEEKILDAYSFAFEESNNQ